MIQCGKFSAADMLSYTVILIFDIRYKLSYDRALSLTLANRTVRSRPICDADQSFACLRRALGRTREIALSAFIIHCGLLTRRISVGRWSIPTHIETFRFYYEYEPEYEYNFSNLAFAWL